MVHSNAASLIKAAELAIHFRNSDGKLESRGTLFGFITSNFYRTHRVSVIISNNFLIIYLITFVLTEDESNKM